MKKLIIAFVALLVLFGTTHAKAEDVSEDVSEDVAEDVAENVSEDVSGDGLNGLYFAPKFVYSSFNTNLRGYSANNSDDFGNYSNGLSGGALAVGYDYKPESDINGRLELEYTLNATFSDTATGTLDRPNTNLSSDIQISTLFVNAYYDFHNSTRFVPYLGAGAGLAFIDFKAYTGNYVIPREIQINFAWHLGFGVSFSFTDNIAIDLGYRYVEFSDAETGIVSSIGASVDNIRAHQGMLGVRFTF